MKKEYIQPLAVEINIGTEVMLVTSIGKGNETLTPDQAWSNERRGEWGNLWK